MTINSWLKQAVDTLAQSNIATARLDTAVLLADALYVDKSWLHAHPEFELNSKQISLLNAQIERRKNHEPLAYIRGKQEFYGRDFFVSPDTLTPRPETETMIEVLLAHLSKEQGAMSNEGLQIIDVGTGSGCIIITAALELSSILNPQSSIQYLGLDISKPALKIAQKNAKNLQSPVTFAHFDLRSGDLGAWISDLGSHSATGNSNFQSASGRTKSLDLRSQSLDGSSKIQDRRSKIYLANLPYVPDDFHINLAASHEPPFAIFGGKDGLDYYRLLFEQLSQETRVKKQEVRQIAAPPNSKIQAPRSITVFTESLPPQHKDLENIANLHGFRLQKTQDFIQMFVSNT